MPNAPSFGDETVLLTVTAVERQQSGSLLCVPCRQDKLVKKAADEVYSLCYCGEAEAKVGTASAVSTKRSLPFGRD